MRVINRKCVYVHDSSLISNNVFNPSYLILESVKYRQSLGLVVKNVPNAEKENSYRIQRLHFKSVDIIDEDAARKWHEQAACQKDSNDGYVWWKFI